VVKTVYEREHIPEEISDFELELIMIFLGETLPNLLYLIPCSINVVFNRRFTKPTVEFTVAFLEPEQS
jgi:hypothetical protein